MVYKKIKKFGQHFLQNPEILEFEARAANPTGKQVLEIGAGDGRLSEILLSLKPKKLILVEIDPELCSILKNKFENKKNVLIKQANFLDLDIKKVELIVGNIPYSITSKILLKLTKIEFDYAILMLQKEVCNRIIAKPATSEYGRLSVIMSAYFEITTILEVSKENFYPKPKVDSTIIKIIKKPFIKLPENFELITAALFSHRLMNVKNALYHSRKMLNLDKTQIKEIIKKIKNDKKVFMLNLNEIIEIANQFQGAKNEI